MHAACSALACPLLLLLHGLLPAWPCCCSFNRLPRLRAAFIAAASSPARSTSLHSTSFGAGAAKTRLDPPHKHAGHWQQLLLPLDHAAVLPACTGVAAVPLHGRPPHKQPSRVCGTDSRAACRPGPGLYAGHRAGRQHAHHPTGGQQAGALPWYCCGTAMVLQSVWRYYLGYCD
jgi:hypothetical protein